MLKDYKEVAESALKRFMVTNEEIVEDSETQESEKEEQKIYIAVLRLVVGKLRKLLKGK